MADQQTQQPGGDFVWAKLPGNKWAKFPKGTTPDQARQQLTARGLLKAPAAPAATPEAKAQQTLTDLGVGHFGEKADPKLDNASHIGQMAGEGVKEFGQMLWNTGKDIVQNPNWVFGKESVYEHLIGAPAARQAMIASAAYKLHQYDRASLHETIGAVPMVGPWIMDGLYEGLNSNDPWGHLAKFESQMAAGELGGKALEKLPSKDQVVAKMRQSAGKLDARATGTAAPMTSMTPAEMSESGRAMAEGKIIGTRSSLPRKIEMARQAKHAEVMQRVQQADAAGHTADVRQSLDNAVNTAKQRAVSLGSKKAMTDLDAWKERQSSTVSTQPNAQGKYTTTPRNLQGMKASELLERSQALEKDAGWEDKNPPDYIENAAKLYRKAINDHLEQTAPGTSQLRADESGLIRNRDAAQALMQSNFERAKRAFQSYFSSPGTLGAYALLKGMGLSWMGALAPVVGLKTLWDLPLNRTARAALLSWASDIVEGKRQSAVNGGGAQPPTAMSPAPQPPTGMGPTGGGAPGLPPAPGVSGGPPSAPPFAPATVVSTNPGPPGAPGPTGAVPTPQAVMLAVKLLPASAPIEQVMVAAQQIKATTALKAAVGAETGGSAPKGPEAPISQSGAGNPPVSKGLQAPAGAGWRNPMEQAAPGNAQMRPYEQRHTEFENFKTLQAVLQRQQFMLGTAEMIGQLPMAPGDVSFGEGRPSPTKPPVGPPAQPKITRVAEGVSGNPKAKAMLDRLDELTQRKPKSGKEASDIKREIEQIKQAVAKSTDIDKTERGKIEKKIADRERLAAKREQAKGETEGAVSTGPKEPTDRLGNIERWSSLIEQGVEKLRSFGPWGDRAAEAFLKEAAQHNWSPHEQMAQLAEQIEFLKEMGPSLDAAEAAEHSKDVGGR